VQHVEKRKKKTVADLFEEICHAAYTPPAAASQYPSMPATVVDHLVLLKLLDPRNTAELTSAIQTLSTLPGVKSITCGPTFVPNGSDDRRGGYNYAITCRFANRAALQNYAEHADHLAVKRDFIAPNLDKSQPNPVLAVDFSATRGEAREVTRDGRRRMRWQADECEYVGAE